MNTTYTSMKNYKIKRMYCSDDSLDALEKELSYINNKVSNFVLGYIKGLRFAPKAIVNVIMRKTIENIIKKSFSKKEYVYLLNILN